MRYKDLMEGNKEVSIEWIEENCSDAIEDIRRGNIIFKGMSSSNNAYFLRTENKTRRKAAYALSNLHTNIVNRTNLFSGFPKREHIGTSSTGKASQYGMVFVMLPLNGALVGICPSDDIFYSFGNIKNHNLEAINEAYRVLKMVSEEFLDDNEIYFNTIGEVKELFKKLHYIYRESMFDADDGETFENVAKSSLKHINDNWVDFTDNVILPCIKRGSATQFLKLFDKVGDWDLQRVGSLNLPKDREIWTDGNVVMIEFNSDIYHSLVDL